MEIKVHPWLCYLRAKHGYERSQEDLVKADPTVSSISLFSLSILGVRRLGNYVSDSAEAIYFSAFRSIIDVLTTCELLLLLFEEFEVQSIFDVENTRSVHLGRRATLQSSRSTFRRGFDMFYVTQYLRKTRQRLGCNGGKKLKNV